MSESGASALPLGRPSRRASVHQGRTVARAHGGRGRTAGTRCPRLGAAAVPSRLRVPQGKAGGGSALLVIPAFPLCPSLPDQRKPALTPKGAPAWQPGPRWVCLTGYRRGFLGQPLKKQCCVLGDSVAPVLGLREARLPFSASCIYQRAEMKPASVLISGPAFRSLGFFRSKWA